jgi:hypothetical protein
MAKSHSLTFDSLKPRSLMLAVVLALLTVPGSAQGPAGPPGGGGPPGGLNPPSVTIDPPNPVLGQGFTATAINLYTSDIHWFWRVFLTGQMTGPAIDGGALPACSIPCVVPGYYQANVNWNLPAMLGGGSGTTTAFCAVPAPYLAKIVSPQGGQATSLLSGAILVKSAIMQDATTQIGDNSGKVQERLYNWSDYWDDMPPPETWTDSWNTFYSSGGFIFDYCGTFQGSQRWAQIGVGQSFLWYDQDLQIEFQYMLNMGAATYLLDVPLATYHYTYIKVDDNSYMINVSS